MEYEPEITSALEIDWNHYGTIRKTNCPELQQVSESFASNSLLVRGLFQMLPSLILHSGWYRDAVYETNRDFSTDRSQFSSFTNIDEWGTKFIDYMHKYRNVYTSNNGNNESKREQDKFSINTLDHLYKMYGGMMLESGLNALFRSAIVNSWTAVEVLVEDLFDAAKNHYPKHYAEINWGGEKNEPLFRSWDRFKKQGKRAFKSNTAIKSPIVSKPLEALSQLRHVLVHKSGIPDEKFKNIANGNHFLQPFRALKGDQKVSLDGKYIKRLIEPSTQEACKLIIAVDQWLFNPI